MVPKRRRIQSSSPHPTGLFSSLGPAYFSPATPTSLASLWLEYGGRTLPQASVPTSDTETITPPPRILVDPLHLPASYYFVTPDDPLIPHLQQRPIVLYNPEWIAACIGSQGLVDIGEWIVDKPPKPTISPDTSQRRMQTAQVSSIAEDRLKSTSSYRPGHSGKYAERSPDFVKGLHRSSQREEERFDQCIQVDTADKRTVDDPHPLRKHRWIPFQASHNNRPSIPSGLGYGGLLDYRIITPAIIRSRAMPSFPESSARPHKPTSDHCHLGCLCRYLPQNTDFLAETAIPLAFPGVPPSSQYQQPTDGQHHYGYGKNDQPNDDDNLWSTPSLDRRRSSIGHQDSLETPKYANIAFHPFTPSLIKENTCFGDDYNTPRHNVYPQHGKLDVRPLKTDPSDRDPPPTFLLSEVITLLKEVNDGQEVNVEVVANDGKRWKVERRNLGVVGEDNLDTCDAEGGRSDWTKGVECMPVNFRDEGLERKEIRNLGFEINPRGARGEPSRVTPF